MALADQTRKVRKALDQALADHIVLTQSKLAQANPKDSGRMASRNPLVKIACIFKWVQFFNFDSLLAL